MSDLVLLQFDWNGQSPLHSGYSSEFAKFAKEYVGRRKLSVNLETRDAKARLRDAFLASSVKGVFRSASGWLVEKMARDLQSDRQAFLTCEYIAEQAWKTEKHNDGCPVCRVYGGSGCRVGETYREKGRVDFTFGRVDNAMHPGGRMRSYYFAHEQVSGHTGGNPLEVETLETENRDISLDLRIQPATDLAVALTCLAADLISSGFFRFGRFTSRGYGVVRLVPSGSLRESLFDLLEKEELEPDPTDAGSGYDLAEELLDEDPLAVVRREVQDYIDAEES